MKKNISSFQCLNIFWLGGGLGRGERSQCSLRSASMFTEKVPFAYFSTMCQWDIVRSKRPLTYTHSPFPQKQRKAVKRKLLQITMDLRKKNENFLIYIQIMFSFPNVIDLCTSRRGVTCVGFVLLLSSNWKMERVSMVFNLAQVIEKLSLFVPLIFVWLFILSSIPLWYGTNFSYLIYFEINQLFSNSKLMTSQHQNRRGEVGSQNFLIK